MKRYTESFNRMHCVFSAPEAIEEMQQMRDKYPFVMENSFACYSAGYIENECDTSFVSMDL